MPCFDPRDGENESAKTRFCCETLSQMVREGIPIPVYIQDWWDLHQKWDAENGRPHTATTHVPTPPKVRKKL